MITQRSAAQELRTLRDFLRYAVSRFNAAGLVYGHGTATARDEAAFMVLEGLHLPVDELDPYLDARLTIKEREHLAELIEARVTRRVPAPYLLGRAYVGGVSFRVDERVIVPRSYIGELLRGELFAGESNLLIGDPRRIHRVLDLCTGSGSLAVLAALTFPEAEIDAVDLSADALAVARTNVEEHGFAERIRLLEGDLFAPVAAERYDLILSNPPYVDAEAMAALPPEYRHEPALALAGGVDGLDVVRRILAELTAHLEPGGGLLCEIGRGRERLETEFPDVPFLWLDTEGSEGEIFWLTADNQPNC
ncbi:MAG TPA: 50S ribosomal protein L3 N(5)-glutamine methyltransferase [Stellaceae bacterium]|nr:50S ribosomal protein L3 N(5)-glutamine methyltransferase [Stellaceae bacterium]